MSNPIRILLQTTIPPIEDDWNISRFSLLRDYLAFLTDANGNALYTVNARDRQTDESGNDPVLSQLDRSQFDQLWLFALDGGDGLSPADCAGIMRFHHQGGGMMTTRDHQDMGISMLALAHLGTVHHFQTQNPDPDPSRCTADDCYTTTISWPNYHSGRNGDYQRIMPVEPVHDLLRRPDSSPIDFFPAHPHEGSIGIPEGSNQNGLTARVIATGISKVTGRVFNLAIAGEPNSKSNHELDHESNPELETNGSHTSGGRFVAQSTFHHFVDYNWDSSTGCPSFVSEAPGDGMETHPQALEDIQTYVRNLAHWLSPKS